MKIAAIFAAAFSCLAAGPAWAADCKPLTYYTGVPMAIEHGAVLIPVTLNGKPAAAIFDTGGVTNNLEAATVKELGLSTRRSPVKIINVSGMDSDEMVVIDHFSIGALDVSSMEFQVSPMNLHGVAAELATSFSYAFDVDMDFGGGRLNFFLPDHCPGNVTYWPSNGIAEIPITLENTHMKIPVTLDGVSMTASIDTGATHTMISAAVAQRQLGISPDEEPAAKDHANGDPNLPLYAHKFSTLDMGGVVVHNPMIRVMPDRVNSRDQIMRPGSHILDRKLVLPDITIGLDILSKLHLYISYKERKLYVGAADDKAAKLLPPPVRSQ